MDGVSADRRAAHALALEGNAYPRAVAEMLLLYTSCTEYLSQRSQLCLTIVGRSGSARLPVRPS